MLDSFLFSGVGCWLSYTKIYQKMSKKKKFGPAGPKTVKKCGPQKVNFDEVLSQMRKNSASLLSDKVL